MGDRAEYNHYCRYIRMMAEEAAPSPAPAQEAAPSPAPAQEAAPTQNDGPLPFPIPPKKTMGIIICALGGFILLFLIIALPTKGWNSGDVTVSGTKMTVHLGLRETTVEVSGGVEVTADNTGDAKDAGDAATGLLAVTVVFVAIGIGLAIATMFLATSPFAQFGVADSMIALGNIVTAALSWLFTMAGWANWVDNFDKDLSYSFAFAVLAWILLFVYLAAWVLAYFKFKADEGSGGDEHGSAGENQGANKEANPVGTVGEPAEQV